MTAAVLTLVREQFWASQAWMKAALRGSREGGPIFVGGGDQVGWRRAWIGS